MLLVDRIVEFNLFRYMQHLLVVAQAQQIFSGTYI